MPVHDDSVKVLNNHGKTFSQAGGLPTLTAPNTNFSMQEIRELIIACEANGQELVLTAGSLKIRPLNSNL